MADRLNPNDDLVAIGSITSENGRSKLVMQGDGNLVLDRVGSLAQARDLGGSQSCAMRQYALASRCALPSGIVLGLGELLVIPSDGRYSWVSGGSFVSQGIGAVTITTH